MRAFDVLAWIATAGILATYAASARSQERLCACPSRRGSCTPKQKGDPMTEPAPEEQNGLGPCAGCGHDPACGFSSVSYGSGPELWLCHTDDHSCYVAETVTAGVSVLEPRLGFTP